MSEPLSYRQYEGDGATTLFSVPFPYLSQAHISVTVAGVAATFSWVGSAQVQVTPAPAANTVVEVRRSTPNTAMLTSFVDGALLGENDLDAADTQLLYVTQEALDTANSALNITPSGTLDARNLRVTNVADPVDPQDAVNRRWAETKVLEASASADRAETEADASAKSADAARLSETNVAAAEGRVKTSETNAAASADAAAKSAALLGDPSLEEYADLKGDGTALPYVRKNLERNRDGLLSIMNWIDPAKRTAIQNREYTGGLNFELQTALNDAENIAFNKGSYPLSDKLVQTAPHQKLVGTADRRDVRFTVDSNSFNMLASSILQLQHYGTVEDITIEAAQPTGGSTSLPNGGLSLAAGGAVGTATQIKQYPWAVDVSNATNAALRRVQMRRTYNGILGAGNCGDLNLVDIEDGCVNRGLHIDGALNFVNVANWKSWCYYGDDLGQYPGVMTYCYQNPSDVYFGRADGLIVTSISMWKKRVLIDQSNTELAATFDVIKCDGGDAHVIVGGGRVIISALNGLTEEISTPLLHVSNASKVVVGQFFGKVASASPNPTAPLVLMDGTGSLAINGGVITGTGPEPEVIQTGGLLQLTNINFDGLQTTVKPNGQINQNGGGRLMVKNCFFTDAIAGASPGYAIYLTTNDHHNIVGNFMGGRRIRRPSAPAGYITGNTGLLGEDVF